MLCGCVWMFGANTVCVTVSTDALLVTGGPAALSTTTVNDDAVVAEMRAEGSSTRRWWHRRCSTPLRRHWYVFGSLPDGGHGEVRGRCSSVTVCAAVGCVVIATGTELTVSSALLLVARTAEAVRHADGVVLAVVAQRRGRRRSIGVAGRARDVGAVEAPLIAQRRCRWRPPRTSPAGRRSRSAERAAS